MGGTPSLPNFSLKFKSDCCNGQEDEVERRYGEDMVRRGKRGWLRRSLKASDKRENGESQKCEMVERTACLQFKQADEKEISYQIVSNARN